jgi:regulator of sirC expression with transglutaminase-like and TPR domain
MAGPVERIVELLQADVPPLDRLMVAVASVDRPPPTEDEVVEHLDTLAAQLEPVGSLTDLLSGVFGSLGFRGNTSNYYDARNSLLHRVLDRRVGIPLSLAVVASELGRRLGFELRPIGMPGHVLLGSESGEWFDPFAAGAPLTRSECETMYRTLRPDAPFHHRYLEAMPAGTVVARTVENLRVAHLRSGNRSALADVLRLRADLPGAPPEFRLESAAALASLGRYDAAAAERDLLATLQPARADRHRNEAKKLRAHRN